MWSQTLLPFCSPTAPWRLMESAASLQETRLNILSWYDDNVARIRLCWERLANTRSREKKQSTQRQREVWDGAGFSDAAIPPPAPPLLSSPSNLTVLESSDDEPLWMSVRDGRSFFDHLAADDSMCEYFGKPSVSRAIILSQVLSRQSFVPFLCTKSKRIWRTRLMSLVVATPYSSPWLNAG